MIAGALLLLAGLTLVAAFALIALYYLTDVLAVAEDSARAGLAVLFIGFAVPAGVLGWLAMTRAWRSLREPSGDPTPVRYAWVLLGALALVGFAAVALVGWDIAWTGAAVFTTTVIVEGWVTASA